MFEASTLAEDGRRYATRNGIAFVAVNSNDGTWHGYPIPWQDVPDQIRRSFIDQGAVTGRAIRRQTIPPGDIQWALDTDDDGRRQR